MIDAATLLAYPEADAAPPIESRLRATVAALAKLKNDRAELSAMIENRVRLADN